MCGLCSLSFSAASGVETLRLIVNKRMIAQAIVDDILAAEFSGEFATDEQKLVRTGYVVRRVGTSSRTAVLYKMIDECQHQAAIWPWGDGSTTVVDIRPQVKGKPPCTEPSTTAG